MDLELRSDVRELPVVEIAMLYTIISFLTVAKLSYCLCFLSLYVGYLSFFTNHC